MKQITEDYVSFEIAQLLEEKGFDGDCDYWYDEYGERCCSPSVISVECWCPSQSLALKWLREVHKIHIITIPYAPFDRSPNHPGEADLVYIAQMFRGIIPIESVGRSIIKLTNEQAIDAALLYVLKNLI